MALKFNPFTSNFDTVLDKASEIKFTPAGSISATDTQAAVEEVSSDADQALLDAAAAQTDIDNHIADATDAHDASAISNVPAGTIAATDVQTAINELDGDIQGHITDATDAHAASAITNTPSGNLAATDVQSALNELQSDIDTRALDANVIKKNGSVDFTADQSMGGFKLTNLATPTSATDAANKQYVDNVALGAKAKEAVRAATTADITLSGEQTIDGVSIVTGDRVLVKDQSTPANNGIYVADSGSWTRSADFNEISPIDEINGAYTAVQEGTVNEGFVFVQYGTVTTIGVDAINFTYLTVPGSYTAGNGIDITGSTISVLHDGEGLTFSGTNLALELDGSTLSKSATGVKVADQGITNTQVSNSAGIVYSKLDLTDSIVNADINSAAAIAYSKLDLANSIVDADIATGANIDASKIGTGVVSNTEFNYLDGVTSAIQDQLDAKEAIKKTVVSVSSDVTLTQDAIHLVDTTSARNLTMPSTPATGTTIHVKDISGQANVNNITLVRAGSESIEGVAANYVIDESLESNYFIADASGNWWII